MAKTELTLHEHIKFSQTGKLPQSFIERRGDVSERSNEDDLKSRFEALPDDTTFPKHYGGGNFFLSDGSTVAGKEDAVKAQKDLDSGG